MAPTWAILDGTILCLIVFHFRISQGTGSPPTFDNFNTRGSVAENTGTGTSFFAIAASDVENDALTIALTSTGVPFQLVGQDLQVNGALDFETTNYYLLNFTVDDGTTTVEGWLNVDITDVNDNVPAISGGLSINIDEEQAVGTIVPLTFTATDADAGDTLSYTLSGIHSPYFTMELSDGTVKIAQRLDREAATPILIYNQLILTVTDTAGQTATVSLTITLDDINDNTPTCSATTYYATIPENTAADTTVQTLTCTDADASPNGDMTMSIFSGDDATAKFKVSGQEILTTGTATDYETKTSYTLVINVADAGATPKIGTSTVIVTISAVNEHVPTIAGTGLSVNIDEEQAVGTIVPLAIVGSDGDNGDPLTYTLTGTHAPYFSMEASSGQVKIAQRLDREATTPILVYNLLTVTVTDTANQFATASLTITLDDINDNTPQCTQSTYLTSIPEGSAVDTTVQSITCTDADASPNGDMTVSIFSGDDATAKFKVSGQDILTTATPTNAVTKSSYTLVINVVDGGATQRTGTTTVAVTVAPTFNSNAPTIPGTGLSVNIDEEQAEGTVVPFTIGASDADPGDTLTYTLTGLHAPYFTMELSDGTVKVAQRLDREAATPILIYNQLLVTVTDTAGQTATASLTVTLDDINDNTPQCSATTYYATIPENTGVDTTVQTLTCTDADASPNGDMTMSIFSGDDATAKFKVSGLNILTTATPTDYETKTSYTLVINVADGGGTPNVATSTVIITISAMNEHVPAIAGTGLSVNIDEEQAVGTVVPLTITASDGDADDPLTYTLSGTHAPFFSIGSTTGQVKIAQRLDREPTTPILIYNLLTVTVTDTAGQFATASLTITLDDINDNTPVCTQSTYYATVPEGSAVDTAVQTLTCTDADASPNGDMTVSIVSGDDATAKFKVSGQNILTTATATDAATKSSYTLVINVVDGGATQKTGTTTVEVTVALAFNNNAPTIAGTGLSVNINEEQAIGTVVPLTISASDADTGDTLSYTLTGIHASYFSMEITNGQVKVAQRLDRDAATPILIYNQLLLTVTDTAGQTATASLTITLDDINDNTPQCTDATYYATIAENSAADTTVQTLVCTDADPSPNGDMTVSIVSGDDATPKFKVSGQNILTTATPTDAATKASYALVINVADGGGTPNVATSTVIVTISPANDNAPTISGTGLSININEEQAVSTVVPFSFTVGDADLPADTLTYTLSGVHAPYFSIDSASGQVRIAQRLDREAATPILVYNLLTLTVTDAASQSATASLTVTLDDINDNTPTCTDSTYFATIPEGSAVDTAVTTLTCTDADASPNSDMTVSIVSGDDATAKFKVTGQNILTTASPTNSATKSSYTLVINVVDGGATPKTGTSSVIVTIAPANNNNAPTIGAGGLSVNIDEEQAVGTVVPLAIVGSDADPGDTLTYTLSGVHAPYFSMETTNGQVKIAQRLDREATTPILVYNLLIVTVTDTASQSATATLTITLDDINDNTPECTQSTYFATIPESSAVDTTVKTLTCTDADASPNGDMTVSIISGDDATAKFKVSGQEILTTASPTNSVTKSSYTLLINVVDGGATPKTGTTSVIVTIAPANNNNSPTIGAGGLSVNVDEEEAEGTVVPLAIVGSDADPGDTLTYTLSGAHATFFSMDLTTGQVRNAKRLDREAATPILVYNLLTVTVTDTAGQFATASLTVTLDDINDNTPQCSDSTYYATIAENSPVDSTVSALTCTDADASPNGDMTVSIVSGDDATVKFKVTGQNILTTGTATDYETTTAYTLVINVVDGGATPNTGTTTVVVTILPENEASPVWGTFTPPTAPYTVAENVNVGTSVVTLAATDADDGVDGTITYSLVSTTDSGSNVVTGIFTVDAASGQLSTTTTLDRETISSYSVTVRASDGGTPTANSVDQTFTINIGDYNDHTPVFTGAPYSNTLAETGTTTAGTTIVAIAATDGDATSTLSYAIEDGDTTRFQIGASAVELKTAINLDSPANDPDYYVLRIIVTDGGSPELTGTTSVTVSITADNDHDPVLAAGFPSTVSLAENSAQGTLVETVAATDLDVGVDGQISYSITGGNTNNDFSIDPSNGQINLYKQLDFVTTPTYTLEVTASDGGSPVRSVTTVVTVNVNNINDNSPACPSYVVYVTKLESSAVNDPVTTLACTDADGDTLTYSITSGNADGKFALNPGTGALTLAATLDYDSATTSYSLAIQVSDSTNTRTVTVNVDVGAVNEDTPAFATNPTTSLSESDAPGKVVHTYTAVDTDFAPHDITEYAITGVTQSGSSKFSIDLSSGIITLVSSVDYDSLPSGTKFYLITVTATDGGVPALTGTGTVTVSVTDVNDNAPSCTPSSRTLTVPEDTATLTTNLGCTDVEDGTTLTYTISQTPGTHFGVTAGTLTLTSALDYETNTGHIVTITVTDAGTPASSTTVTVNMYVGNVNDGPPSFTGTFASTIPENISPGTSVIDVVATDPDGSNELGNPVYSILSGDANNQFTIDARTGQITTISALDRETQGTYNLVIRAKESADIGSATVTATITVSDINDNPPLCTAASFVETVSEAEAAGFAVHTLTCTDLDTTGTLSYTLTSGDAVKFEMNTNVFQLKAPLDFESGVIKYDVTITVSDTVNSIVVTGTVHVGNVNEAPPVFAPVTYSVSFSESTALTSTITTVLAMDADSAATPDGEIAYAFVASYPLFALDSTSGLITLASSLDWETSTTHDLLVTATDGTTTVTATVSVTVTDENEHSPVFGSPTYSGTVSEGDAIGASVVATVAATDQDDPATNGNGQVTYSIIAGDINSDFTIGANNGQITTVKQLDYETAVSYLLTVQVVDRGGDAQSKSSTAVVSVTVTSVNEFDPVFSPATVPKSVPETTGIGTLIHQAVATDADSGVDGDITYTMPSHAKLTLAVDGALTLKDNLNAPSGPYTLTITATDGGTSARTAVLTVTVTVTDVNDVTPSCSPSSIVVSMREDATGNVASLTCTDTDTGASGTLTHTIESVNAVAGTGPFAVDSSSGAIIIGANLDYETATAHTIIIRVQDGAVPSLSTSATVDVAVTDVNEAAPVFSGAPFNPNVAESESAGHPLLTVVATDADTADTISYSLSDTTNLQIGSATGIITLKVQQDRETSATFSVNVCATDSGVVDAVKTTCETVTVTVTDVNDNLPIFNPGVYTANVDENIASGTTVTTVTATDLDAGSFGTVIYSIASGNTDTVLAIDGSSGHITVASPNTFLDYERTQSFTLTVRATDGGGQTSDVSVSITVNPINEGTPTFTPSSSTQTVPENSPGGTTVIDLDATDTDTGSDGQITYSIISGASGKFAIDPSTGIVTVSGVLDIETVPSYTITIQATDAGTNPSAFIGTYTLTVTVTDYNDKTPSCTSSYYSATITESATPTTSVQQVVCSDADTDAPNNVLTFTKTTGDARFDVDVATGLVSVAAGASFDRETTSSFLLDINVKDGGTPGLSVDIQVSVTISDENDNAPAFGQDPYTPSIAEDAVPGTAVVTLTATDADAGTNAQIVYSITAGNVLGHFILDAATGVLSVQAALDRENLALYMLTVQAQDKGSPTSLSGTSIVSITVTDVNDNTPICTSSVYTATTPEDTATTTSLTTVVCSDADNPPNNNVQYTITAGNTGSVFDVDISTGIVSVALGLDAETQTEYTLTVQASDGTLNTNVVVAITVTDVNEFDPAFAPFGPYSAPFAEDTAPGTTILDINAADTDVSNTVLLFSIASGNGDGKFWINTLTGVVVLQAALDRENVNSYSLSIEVGDGVGAASRTATTILTVPVLDVNDNDPSCIPSVYINTVSEDSTTGTTVSSLTCSDVDTSTPTLAYAITNGNGAGKFNIDAASGIITIVSLLDYETTTSYALDVEVSDQGAIPRTITIPVTVEVDPVNEHNPVFSAVTPVTLLENVAIGTSVYQMTATDADKGALHGTVRFSITAGDTLGQFNIDQGTGEIKTVGSLDRENQASYTLSIRATDDFAGSGNERSADINLAITVGDVNDNIPTFIPVVYAQNVLETAPSGSTIVQVTSRDDDDVPNATPVFSITSGNTGSAFTFVGNELLLGAGKTLDYETMTLYTLDIEVSDSGTPPLTSSGKIIITVLSVNEFPPIPAVPNDGITMSEQTPVGTNFYNASASDSDAGTDGQFTWSITNGNVPVTFFCSPQLGELFTSSALDYDNPPNTYNLTVQAQDQGGLTGGFWLEIILSDENDEYPIFTESMYKPLLDENVAVGSTVVTVTANDKDSGTNGQVTYSITSGDISFFAIDNSTGAITTLMDIDYETRNIFFLILSAVDGGSPALSTVGSVRITVVDLNDNAPVFTPDYFAQSISEDVTVGTSVTTVYATDADSAANGNNVFTYSISPTDAFFQVNPGSGQISTKATLDRETQSSHNLTILAIDSGTPPLTGIAVVTVNLDDVNDNDPIITGTYATNVSEATNTGEIVFTILATDIDTGVNAELEFTIVSGNTDGDFQIEIGSGIVQVKNSLDRERTATYNPVIHVIDKGTPRRTASVTATIVIDDINDNNPIFVTFPYNFNIAENVPLGSTVGVIQATDQDALTNAALTYEIVVFWIGVASHFALDTSTGEITTTGNLDRETIATYSLRCRAKDGGTPQLSTDVNVTITIDDLNDNQPVFSSDFYNGTVNENTAAGTSILTVVVTDADPHNGQITLSIDTSTADGIKGNTFLAVDSATGIVSVKAVMDREMDTFFNVTILAVDNGTIPYTSSAIVYVTVNDVNDNTPTFSLTFYDTEIAYTATCDNTIVTLTATDADIGSNGVLSYYYSANPYGFYFAIASSTGAATLTAPVTLNTKYVLEVSAVDGGTPSRTTSPPAAVRVDTFDPNQVAVTISLGISRADFLVRQDQFVSQLTTVMATNYPNCIVKIWCIKERAGEAVTAPTRRRLLTTSPVDVNVIVVSDNTTESQSNLAESKTFLTSSDITSITAADVSGTPSTALQGSAWDYYVIQSVKPYTETVIPWYQTTVGIVFIVLSCLLALALIIVTIVACCICRKKKRPVTPTRALVKEKRPNNKTLFVSRATVPDLDTKALKKNPPPAVVSLPMPTKAWNAPKNDSFWGAPESKNPRVETAESKSGTPNGKRRRSPPRTPRSVVLDSNDGYFIHNRHFDGTAIDPVTNKVYEYNTKTNERRWLSTPDGKAVVATDSLASDV